MKNKGTWIIVGIVAAFVLLIAGIFVSTNNRAVSLEEQVFTADSDIQAQEKRRTDLIYNLADCVKEYDKHEAETLLNVVEARGNNGSTTDIENVTTSIAAVAEAYPELKSNENYKELMNELSTTENMILQYRTAYNNEVRAYKKYVRKFPRIIYLRSVISLCFPIYRPCMCHLSRMSVVVLFLNLYVGSWYSTYSRICNRIYCHQISFHKRISYISSHTVLKQFCISINLHGLIVFLILFVIV